MVSAFTIVQPHVYCTHTELRNIWFKLICAHFIFQPLAVLSVREEHGEVLNLSTTAPSYSLLGSMRYHCEQPRQGIKLTCPQQRQ